MRLDVYKPLYWIYSLYGKKGKSLLDYTIFFSPKDYEKDDKTILKYFQ